jgi:hypothetical protein
VITNLLSNALKFTQSGGRVIFDRFWRGRQAAQTSGSGIGLSVAADLARAHGGQLTAASQPGHGTTMTLTLSAPDLGRPAVAALSRARADDVELAKGIGLAIPSNLARDLAIARGLALSSTPAAPPPAPARRLMTDPAFLGDQVSRRIDRSRRHFDGPGHTG